MAFFETQHVVIRGMAACVPKGISENSTLDIWGSQGAGSFILSTGVERRRISDVKTCTSDLCIFAAEKLLDSLKWNKEEVDCLIFVTQTPDYILPASSCIIQNKLGLSKSCFCLDISLGCSGWIYGLNTLSALLSNGNMKKGLLLTGDTSSKACSKEDKSTYPLFGDAGTVTALEFDEKEDSKMCFVTEVDGSGDDVIIIPDGGFRNQTTETSFIKREKGEGIILSPLQLHLEGMDVFSFGISKAPSSVNLLMDTYNINKEEVDYFIFHQANLFMNEKIRKKLKLPIEKVPYSLKDFGNTSSASIPLTLVTQVNYRLNNDSLSHIACGFGVGLSWGSVYFKTNKITCLDLLEYDNL